MSTLGIEFRRGSMELPVGEAWGLSALGPCGGGSGLTEE